MPQESDPRAAVEAVWRIESARLVGALARVTGDFALAEDLAQEALAEALISWPRDGVPQSPAGWLMTVGKRRAIDHFRRSSALTDRYAALARDLSEGEAAAGASRGAAGPLAGSWEGAGPGGVGAGASHSDLLWDPDRIDDDVLALIFVACHPVLSRESSVALTLRVVGGLGSEEIARAFMVPTATVQARITRAKKTLAAAQVPFEVPAEQDRPERLSQVLSVIYLIFTEGSTATAGSTLMRTDLAHEAIRLSRVLAQLLPQEAEVHGLLALLELTAARFPARLDPEGRPVLLDHQDRRRWDRSAIRRGSAALRRAATVGRGLGAYGLQAAIAECHTTSPRFEDTDWDRVVVLYEALGQLAPSPVVDLNRAVAVSMAEGPATALRIVDRLRTDKTLQGSHLLPTVRGELLTRLGRANEAREELEEALRLCGNEAERQVLRTKLDALPAST
ncbi:RNA polymerase subunit sigma-24 [Ornithinimicrobium sp. F0845]|uniref:RNA polymerase sigma factor n=1 Tax=Ornithinimicrobium sp. F0845 TaxID=2926412 RepID=UPI001FF47947|nr:RNA polymerase subunit sigma-24 [Ornithinimicrobium sp. F0845]